MYIYGRLYESDVIYSNTKLDDTSLILMSSDRPSDDKVANSDGTWIDKPQNVKRDELNQISILGVRRGCRSIGVEYNLDKMIRESGDLEIDWDESNFILLNDPSVQTLMSNYGIDVDDLKDAIIANILDYTNDDGAYSGQPTNEYCDRLIEVSSNLGTTLNRTEIDNALNGKPPRQKFYIKDSNNHIFELNYDSTTDKFWWVRLRIS